MSLAEYSTYRTTKDAYFEMRRNGRCRKETVDQLAMALAENVPDRTATEWLLFWVAIADAQCCYRELAEEISKKALAALEQEGNCLSLRLTSKELEKKRNRYIECIGPEKQLSKRTKKNILFLLK